MLFKSLFVIVHLLSFLYQYWLPLLYFVLGFSPVLPLFSLLRPCHTHSFSEYYFSFEQRMQVASSVLEPRHSCSFHLPAPLREDKNIWPKNATVISENGLRKLVREMKLACIMSQFFLSARCNWRRQTAGNLQKNAHVILFTHGRA